MAYRANPNLARRLVRAKLKHPSDETNYNNSRENDTVNNSDDNDNDHNSNSNNNNSNSSNIDIVKLANLKHLTTQTPVFLNSNNSVTHCSNAKCPLHTKLINSRQVRSRVSRRTYHTHNQATCDTPNVVYLIQCKNCGRQYVGQTLRSLKARFAKHLQAIKDRYRPGVLQEHFRRGECGSIDNITLQLLYKLPHTHDTPENIEESLKQHETLWIDRLKCEYPQGLNWARYDPTKRHNT